MGPPGPKGEKVHLIYFMCVYFCAVFLVFQSVFWGYFAQHWFVIGHSQIKAFQCVVQYVKCLTLYVHMFYL